MQPGYTAKTQEALERMWTEGRIRPEVSQTWGLEELPLAMRALSERRVLGKAVLVHGFE
jgi:hypothetical protein